VEQEDDHMHDGEDHIIDHLESQKTASHLDQIKEEHDPSSDMLELQELPDLVDLPDLQEAHNALEKVIEKDQASEAMSVMQSDFDGMIDLKRKMEVNKPVFLV